MVRKEKIEEIEALHSDDLFHILQVWEASVRETHYFLSEDNIRSIRPLVELGLAHVRLFVTRGGKGYVNAFMGVAGEKIEMLFLSPAVRGRGLGRAFVGFAVETLHVRCVDVNEQNGQALGFYEKMGFETFARSPKDPQGNPFPILHLRKM